MRTIMMLGGVAVVGSGVFCLANGSAAFISVAFVVGVIFCLMGIIEIVIGRSAGFDSSGGSVAIASDGIIMLLLGIVILAGQITDDNSALMVFALWLMIEAVLSFGKDMFDVREKSSRENTVMAVHVAMLLLSVFMFFNNRLFSIGSIMLIGAGLILIGLSRVLKSFSVKFEDTGFLTGNKERLEEAMDEEKRALAKAKEGIREQKEAQRRIAKIQKDMAMEKSAIEDAKNRKKNK